MVSSINGLGGFSYLSSSRSRKSFSGSLKGFSRNRNSRKDTFGIGFSDFTGLLRRLFLRLTFDRRDRF